jgi:predicted acylesterase/phospholipase RssA
MTSPPSDVERDWPGQLARAEADVDCVLLSPGVLGPDEPWTVFCLADAEWIVAITRGTPRLGETIVRCMTFGSAEATAASRVHADLVITPGVADIALLDWHRLPEAREAGILAARQALEQHAGFFAQIGVS